MAEDSSQSFALTSINTRFVLRCIVPVPKLQEDGKFRIMALRQHTFKELFLCWQGNRCSKLPESSQCLSDDSKLWRFQYMRTTTTFHRPSSWSNIPTQDLLLCSGPSIDTPFQGVISTASPQPTRLLRTFSSTKFSDAIEVAAPIAQALVPGSSRHADCLLALDNDSTLLQHVTIHRLQVRDMVSSTPVSIYCLIPGRSVTINTFCGGVLAQSA